MTSPDFPAAVDWLYALKAQGTKFGIDRMRAFAAELGHPERAVPSVHIAGTNGKGSVAAMLDSILRAAHWRTGLYTSPHLVHVGERVQVERCPLTEVEIVAYTEELRPIAERIAAEEPQLAPTFFEYMTAMAFLQFGRTQCDIAVIEVGLGGRLDATNIVTPEVSVITSIGLDHCELLGNELTQIAAEKAGIIKHGVPVVIGRMPREAETVIRTIAERMGAPAISVGEKFGDCIEALPRTNLQGDYQRWNAATAMLAARLLPARWRIDAAAIQTGLANVAWAGRWEPVMIGGRRVILDAAHNPEGAQTLDENLRELVAETGRPPVVIVGVLGSTRAGPLIEVICRWAANVHLVVPKQPRACSYEELETAVPAAFRGRIIRDTVEHLFPNPNQCVAATGEDVVVVTGSIYLLGEVMTRLAPRGAESK